MDFDLLVRGARVVDGTGSPAIDGDVGVVGDRIVAVGAIPDPNARRVIEAGGHVVAPGFIDVHVHSETALRGNDDQYGSVLQGVTTHLTSPDGFGWAPLPDGGSAALWRETVFAYGRPELAPEWPTIESYLSGLEGTPVNVVPMAPHQAIRFAVMGWDPRPANADQLDRMKAIARDWLDAGAVGLNTGLDYPPAALVSMDEIVELCRVVAERGGMYASHVRYQGLGRHGALREAAEIGRRAGVPVRISHESVDRESALIFEEEGRDVDLTFDWYVYPAGSSHLMVMMPVEEQVGGLEALLDRLKEPKDRQRLAAMIEERLLEQYATGAREYFADTHTGRHIGRSISEIATERGLPLGETAIQLLEEESPEAVLVFRRGTSDAAFEQLARRTVAHAGFTLASDGLYHGARPHPRGYGCFARFLRWAVRDLRAISLEHAVRVMSAAPAERFGITDRGRIATGQAADLVIFDPDTVADHATWEQPRGTPTGIDAVIVNGEIVVERGTPTGRHPGRVVRHGGRH